MNNNPLGIMQGRLLPPINGRIQAFPVEQWAEEFFIARDLGLDCIEFIFESEDYKTHPLIDQNGIDKIKEIIKITGVNVLSVCADYFMDFPLHDIKYTEESTSVLIQLIENCSLLRVKNIVVPCVDKSSLSSVTDTEKFVAAVGKCLPLAEQRGINLALETDLPPEDFLNLLKKFHSPCIKVNYDIGNSASLGYSPLEELDAYGEWISDVHIKDRVYKGSTVPLGKGNANIPLVLKKLKEINFSGIYILQAARKEIGKEKETVKEYIGFLKNCYSMLNTEYNK